MNWEHGEYRLTDDRTQLDLDAVMRLLGRTYWADKRPRDLVEKAIERSLCFGLFHGRTQVGFARAVTDSATFTWICDVILDPAHRGGGLGKWMVSTLIEHPEIVGTRQVLATRDAHTLYERFGFHTEEPRFFLTRKFPRFAPAPQE